MYIVNGNEKRCCTCDHWTGVRAMEESGAVYSLENLEGICKDVATANRHQSGRILTLPGAHCDAWAQWPDLLS